MKRLMLLTLVMILGATMAFAQAGRIAVYGDPAASNCAVTATAPGLISVYIFHIETIGAVGCEYAAPKPDCFAASYLSDTNVFPVSIGNSQTGISVGYGTCRQGPILVQTLSYFLAAPMAATCCIYPIVPHPINGLNMVDCADNLLNPAAQSGVVNEAQTCTCSMIVPVEDTSWGQIKALYNE